MLQPLVGGASAPETAADGSEVAWSSDAIFLDNVGALKIRIAFWGVLIIGYNIIPILIIKAPTLCCCLSGSIGLLLNLGPPSSLH